MTAIYAMANANNSKYSYIKSESDKAASISDSAAFQRGWAMSDEAYEKEQAAGFRFRGQVLDKNEYPPLGSQTARTGPYTSLPVQVLAAPSSTSPTTSSASQAEWDTKVLEIKAICGTDDYDCIEGMAWSYINKSQEEKDEEAFYIGGKLLEMIH